MRLTALLVLIVVLLCGKETKAQFGGMGCVDSLSFAIDNPPCIIQNNFIPVCGCDEVTYPNICFWQYAALNFYEEGPCEQVAFHIYPNPVREFLNVEIATRFEADVNLYIFDSYGTIVFYRFYRNITYDQLFLPVYEFRQGLYFIRLESFGEAYTKKFMKWD
jgi:hypothetical protein